MKECNNVTKLKKVGGRRRIPVYLDPTKEVTETMLVLAQLKNEGRSWRSLADEINDRVTGKPFTHTLVRNVTLGLCKSPRIDYALGIREAPPPVEVTPCLECGKVHKLAKGCTSHPAPAGMRRLALWVTEEQFEIIRAAWDSHPDGRVAWNLEKAGYDRTTPTN